MTRICSIRPLVTALLLAGVSPTWAAGAAGEVCLAKDGRALFPVVVSTNTSERVRQTAASLADYLSRIAGAPFAVQEGQGASGLVVGVTADFPGLPPGVAWSGSDLAGRERYVLRSHPAGVYLVGATEMAVEHAVWDFLYRLGYRQFFPAATWEIVPRMTNLSAQVDADERPDYLTRVLGYTLWDHDQATWEQWLARNRVRSPLTISCGHHYQAILANNKAAFKEHPEYLGLVAGKRKSSKFCISNPGLRQLVVDYALRHFEKNPGAQSISMEPSDGGGWCECEACAALGSVSDRAVTLANEVARAIRPQGKLVGMLAYSEHALPPHIRVESNVTVRVTTHQAKGHLTLDERIAGWARQGAMVGVSDAYCTFVWDYFLPARQNGSDLGYLRTSISHFHDLGVRIMGGWSAGSWGTVGLGNYLSARLLWDVDEARRTGDLVSDFLDKSFGPARPPMEKFFGLLYRLEKGDPRPMLSEHMIGQMYRLLDEARALAADPAARARLDDLVLYTRYVDLFFIYQNARSEAAEADIFQADYEPPKSERQQAFEALIQFTYRIRKTEMVQSRVVYSSLGDMDKQVFIPKEAGWGVPEGKNPWKKSDPFTCGELNAILTNGISHNNLLDFEPVRYSANLAPARALRLSAGPPGRFALPGRQRPQRFYTWVNQAPDILALEATCGLYEKNRGPMQITLYSPQSLNADNEVVPVAETNAPPDGSPHRVSLATSFEGLHWIEVKTLGDRAALAFKDPDRPCTVESSIESQGFSPVGDWSLYFYVPPGVSVVGGYASERSGKLLDGNGRVALSFEDLPKPGYFKAPVPEGQSGRLWKFENCTGHRLLMTVPPYLARRAEELLLPAELVTGAAAQE